MNVTWEAVGVLAAVTALANGFAVHIMRLEIRSAIAQNNEALIERINGSYLKSEVAKIQFEQLTTAQRALEARLAALELRIDTLEEQRVARRR